MLLTICSAYDYRANIWICKIEDNSGTILYKSNGESQTIRFLANKLYVDGIKLDEKEKLNQVLSLGDLLYFESSQNIQELSMQVKNEAKYYVDKDTRYLGTP